MRGSKIVTLLLAVCSVPLLASADVLMLKDGRAITGRFQGADQTTLNFLVNGQTLRYQISDINSITFTSSGATSSAGEESSVEGRPTVRRRSAPATTAEGPTSSPSANVADRPYNPPPAGGSGSESSPPLRRRETSGASSGTAVASAQRPLGVTVHAGSVITVRMIDRVDSAVDQTGQTYRASLDEPLVVDGDTVVPRGADVTAKLVSKTEAGRIAGRSELDLVLLDITVGGQRREITTSEVTQSGSSRGKQSAERIGVGTVLGAAIGAIAGGGKGAAIGAATGAGAGTAIQVFTHGEQVKIPPETRLDFTLAQPLNL